MAEEHVMQIDPNYPYGSYESEDQGSAAGNQGQDQSGAQQAQDQGTQAQEPQQGQQGQEPSGDQGAQDQGQQGQGQQDQGQEQNVPVHVLQSIRNELNYYKALAQQNQQPQQQPQTSQQPQQPQQGQGQGQTQDIDSILSQYEDDEDVLTVADMRKIASALQPQGQSQQPQQPQAQQQAPQQQAPGQPDIRELEMKANYPDYDQAINELPNILSQAPHLEQEIRNAENPYKEAYKVYSLYKQFGGAGQGQSQAQGQGQQAGQGQAAQIERNLNRPGTAAQASGGGTLGQANYYASLDDKTLEQEIAKAKRG